MAGNITLLYTASSSLTVTALNAVATQAGLLTGTEIFLYDNTAALDEDVLVSGKITNGIGTAGLIEIHAIGEHADGTWPDAFTGATSAANAIAFANTFNKSLLARPVAVWGAPANGGVYHFGPVSLASLFGGTLPRKVTGWVTQSTGANLGSAHALYVKPVKRAYT